VARKPELRRTQPKDEYTRLLLEAIPKLDFGPDGRMIKSTTVHPPVGPA
jgi:hypothetical protein